MAKWGVQRAIQAIEHTIFKGWIGLREPNESDLPEPWTPERVSDEANAGRLTEFAGVDLTTGKVGWNQTGVFIDGELAIDADTIKGHNNGR